MVTVQQRSLDAQHTGGCCTRGRASMCVCLSTYMRMCARGVSLCCSGGGLPPVVHCHKAALYIGCLHCAEGCVCVCGCASHTCLRHCPWSACWRRPFLHAHRSCTTATHYPPFICTHKRWQLRSLSLRPFHRRAIKSCRAPHSFAFWHHPRPPRNRLTHAYTPPKLMCANSTHTHTYTQISTSSVQAAHAPLPNLSVQATHTHLPNSCVCVPAAVLLARLATLAPTPSPLAVVADSRQGAHRPAAAGSGASEGRTDEGAAAQVRAGSMRRACSLEHCYGLGSVGRSARSLPVHGLSATTSLSLKTGA